MVGPGMSPMIREQMVMSPRHDQNTSVLSGMSANAAMAAHMALESRQSDVYRVKVGEDGKGQQPQSSSIERRSGSINPRRQNPIVKQQ